MLMMQSLAFADVTCMYKRVIVMVVFCLHRSEHSVHELAEYEVQAATPQLSHWVEGGVQTTGGTYVCIQCMSVYKTCTRLSRFPGTSVPGLASFPGQVYQA